MPAEVGGGWSRLGIIAGGGMLPVRIAEAERDNGREPFVVRLFDGLGFEGFPSTDHSIAEPGAIMRTLKAEGCDAVCFAGIVKRPNFASLRPDWRGTRLLPRVLKAARQGDGAIIDVIVSAFEAEGFLVVGAEEASGQLRVQRGPLGKYQPTTDDLGDIVKGARLVEALGPFDAGQGAVLRRGFVLGIEAAEGTDAMLERCAMLPPDLKGFEPGEAEHPCGVLVKVPKPDQELRVDLPTIGVRTIENAHAAGLAGVAVREGAALIVDRDDVRTAADSLGLFVYAFTAEEAAAS